MADRGVDSQSVLSETGSLGAIVARLLFLSKLPSDGVNVVDIDGCKHERGCQEANTSASSGA